jgi:hypothetical protein
MALDRCQHKKFTKSSSYTQKDEVMYKEVARDIQKDPVADQLARGNTPSKEDVEQLARHRVFYEGAKLLRQYRVFPKEVN